jgi:hypothetical protein
MRPSTRRSPTERPAIRENIPATMARTTAARMMILSVLTLLS